MNDQRCSHIMSHEDVISSFIFYSHGSFGGRRETWRTCPLWMDVSYWDT